MRIPLSHYGWRELVAATLVLGAFAALMGWAFAPAAAVPVLLWLFVLAFFRDPQRTPDEADAFVSPADGRVADITPVGIDSALGAEGVRIGVFMSVLDVHVNRCPCDATVEAVEHHAGGFIDARRPEAAERNEAVSLRLAYVRGGRRYTVLVRQVAGLVARRIVTDVAPGQALRAGQRIGMIKFGSRGELLLPAELVGELAVRVGQVVRAGRTVLVRPPAGEPVP